MSIENLLFYPNCETDYSFNDFLFRLLMTVPLSLLEPKKKSSKSHKLWRLLIEFDFSAWSSHFCKLSQKTFLFARFAFFSCFNFIFAAIFLHRFDFMITLAKHSHCFRADDRSFEIDSQLRNANDQLSSLRDKICDRTEGKERSMLLKSPFIRNVFLVSLRARLLKLLPLLQLLAADIFTVRALLCAI